MRKVQGKGGHVINSLRLTGKPVWFATALGCVFTLLAPAQEFRGTIAGLVIDQQSAVIGKNRGEHSEQVLAPRLDSLCD